MPLNLLVIFLKSALWGNMVEIAKTVVDTVIIMRPAIDLTGDAETVKQDIKV